MPNIKTAVEVVKVVHKRLQIITPIPANRRVEMRSTEGVKFVPEFIFSEVTAFADGAVQVEHLRAYGDVGERMLRTDYTYDWNRDEHMSWEDTPPVLLVEHAANLRARNWNEE